MKKRTAARLLLLLLATIGLTHAAVAQNRPPFQVSHSGRFQFVVDHEFSDAKKVGTELESLAQDLWTELMIPDKRTPVRIYLFSTQEAFSAYVQQHIPSLRESDTNRTAMFLLRNDKPYIFAVHTSELMLNLRHEFVHVLLNTSHENLPIWLDEGLAEYYEVSDGEQASFRKLLARQNRLFWKPDVQRLEGLTTMADMGLVEYAEGWSWVHLLLEGPKEYRDVIPQYLSDLRKEDAGSTISQRIAEGGGDAVKNWREHHDSKPARISSKLIPFGDRK